MSENARTRTDSAIEQLDPTLQIGHMTVIVVGS